MTILQAQIETERAGRYLVQFCKHATAMGSGHISRMHPHGPMARREVRVTAEWSDTSGTVTFAPWGECTLTVEAGTLTIRIDAPDEEGLAQIRDVVTRDFERFSRREPVTVTWQRQETPGVAPFRHTAAMTSKPRRGFSRSNLQTILVAPLAMLLVISLHIGVAGTVVAESRWTAAAVNIVVALLVLKIALITWARFRIRRRKGVRTSGHGRGS